MRSLLLGGAMLALANLSALAQVSDDVVKIGVLTDMGGVTADIGGKGSVIAAELALKEFGATVLGKPIQIVAADHQHKADVGTSIARQWFDVDKVDAVVDVPNSAVALALQNVLGDLFASISIGLDKPFVVGEFIAFGTEQGTVTKVGIKSTRIQSLSGEEMAISNSVLLKELIHNHSRRRERRIVFTFRLPFDTARDKIPTAIERVRGFIEAEKPTRFDRGYLSGFGDWGLDFEFVYYVLDPSYNVFVEIQQRINLKMLEAWGELGIEFAVPARKLHAAPEAGSPGVQVSSAE